MLFNDFLKSNAKPLGEITDYNIHAHNDFIDLNTVSNALSKVRKELIDGNVDVSIEQLLNNAKVSVGHYEKALRTCSRGNAIVLKLTNYNPKCYVSMASKYGYTICAECLCLVYDEK